MRFLTTGLPGVLVIEPELIEDERGAFARVYDRTQFVENGLDPHVEQCSVSVNRSPLTLRGMHFQGEDAAETKLVRCTAGRLFDVAVDVRADSPSYLAWTAVELSAENRRTLYLPRGFAHGYLTLEAGTEVFYQISSVHRPDAARGFRWDDPAIGIDWPGPPSVISERDASYPLLEVDGPG